MKKILFASLNKDAGKTGLILGLSKLIKDDLKKASSYFKPMGDRLLYRKKRLWDYDAALMTKILELHENPEDITIGFDHSKLRYMYDDDSLKEKISSTIKELENGCDYLMIEGGPDISYGSSVNLDLITMAKTTNSKIILIASDKAEELLDKLTFLKNSIGFDLISGIIINKVRDIDDFKNTYLETIEEMGIKVLGVLPYNSDLNKLSVAQISDTLLSKVIAGSEGLNNKVKHLKIGSTSISKEFKKNFLQIGDTLIVTSGDRTDIILSAIDNNTAGIVLTNNILPAANIIAQAQQKKIPLLSVALDTHDAAKQIDNIDALLQVEDSENFETLKNMVKENLNIDEILK